MTELPYEEPILSFDLTITPQSWSEVPILEQGRKALEKVSEELGLSFDDWDLDYYTNLFCSKLQRNPTTVECFDLAQSNSEHSRHWFFKGRMVIDGVEKKESLIDMVMSTQQFSNSNNVIKFSDNSSAILGYAVNILLPKDSHQSSSFITRPGIRHIVFTAETHNFPTGVAPFSGATTGTGGRIRDVHATGRGSHVIAGSAAYSFGNLNIPGYILPWEDKTFDYPSNFALPVDIAVEASNGASDYGNKFGEPVILGFARSFGMRLPNGERREWVKPIMFSGGIGSIDAAFIKKFDPQKGMTVVKIGGPVYRIGVGGGSASSVHVQGDQKAELDFNAVQRGDAEMEQKLNRVIRACIELGEGNIICSIHDQGAGGNGNVLKEIVEPSGAIIYCDKFQLGDPTVTTLELWGAEYQESDAILIKHGDQKVLESISVREKCPVNFVGEVVGDGRIVLVEKPNEERHPVDLELDHVLASMPRKIFQMKKYYPILKPLSLPSALSVQLALERVLRLPSVASKRYLTNKVDRSVTGLISQQQCVGPLHTPLADVAVVALSYFDTMGSATSIGEQPIKGLLDPAAGARMSVAEAVTNLMFAPISSLQDAKCSGNWMWAAKLTGEGAALYDACQAMCETMKKLGLAIDGGKDSLSMAARIGKETVKAPGTLVVSIYAPCPDITAVITPDFKCPNGKGHLLYIDLSSGKGRLGGSALAQCFNQLGDKTADLEDVELLKIGFEVTQSLITDNKLTSGHDVSDGGLITCLLEMAFAGNCGITANIDSPSGSVLSTLFGEEVGWIVEVREEDVNGVKDSYRVKGIPCQYIGYSSGFANEAIVTLSINNEVVLKNKMTTLRDIWEETSFQLEYRQTNPECVTQEKNGISRRTTPPFHINFDLTECINLKRITSAPRVAVIREEGTNGDREMVASLHMVGFEVWDVTMSDLLFGKIKLDKFRGVVFPGGFSYADVLGSAKGWAAGLLFHHELEEQFNAFYGRSDTFSLGVCNGCQLMGLLSWVAPIVDESGKRKQGCFLAHNLSERFESRFVAVRVQKSKSIMMRGMEDSILGVWVAHGEGRFTFRDEATRSSLAAENLVALTYVDDEGLPTEAYPFNPNGSVAGMAGVCSPDGRHLAMMPHPERCVFPWQWAWMPFEWKTSVKVSPWVKMFKNAHDWCLEH
ncbi:phosphoribosylformylglycinamidine synthase isoform X2 [Centruroides vittatus]